MKKLTLFLMLLSMMNAHAQLTYPVPEKGNTVDDYLVQK